jgi:hypothetical protein
MDEITAVTLRMKLEQIPKRDENPPDYAVIGDARLANTGYQ